MIGMRKGVIPPRFSSDVQSVLRCIVTLGLDSGDRRVVHETLIRYFTIVRYFTLIR